MKRLLFLLAYFVSAAVRTNAQTDTVAVCAYNLLNYGNSANTHAVKKAWLQPILQAMQPQIVGVSEVSTALPGACDSLLPLMPFPAARGTAYNTTSTTQLNTLYWHNTKFTSLRDTSICNSTRDITAYDLYYNYPGLSTFNDTVKLTVIVAHLKSSNASADRTARSIETACVSNYLSYLNMSANYIMLGDFNLYSSSETAYQNLTNPAINKARLNDPINRPGNWNGDSALKDISTQSPRFVALSDGGASGGLDSRFDFILVSDPILNGTKGIRYIPGTYVAFGNDAQHYNKALMDLPLNTVVSQTIAQYLYNMSDHLPVNASFEFTPLHLVPPAAVLMQSLQQQIVIQNPFTDYLHLTLNTALSSERLNYRLVSIDGRLIQAGEVAPATKDIQLRKEPNAGLYFLQISDAKGAQAIFKLVHW